MEGPGKLKDIFESFEEENNNTQLQWSSMGPNIADGLKDKEEKRKKRFFWWWILGTSTVVLVVGVLFFMFDSKNLNDSRAYMTESKSIDENSPLKNIHGKNNGEEEYDVSKKSREESKVTTDKNALSNIGSKNDITTNELSFSIVRNKGLNSVLDNEIFNSAIVEDKEFQLKTVDVDALTSLFSTLYTSTIDSNRDTNSISRSVRKAIAILQKLEPSECCVLESERHIESPNDINIISDVSNTNNQNSRSAIYIYGGINFSNINQLYNKSSSRVGSSIELGYQKSISENMYISFGVAYEQLRFQTAFEQTEVTQLFRPETIDTIYDFGFGFETYVLTDFIDGTRNRSFGYTNTLNTLSIPIGIGYRFEIGRLNLVPEVGVAFTVDQRKDFRIANSNFEISNRNTKNTWSLYPLFRAGISLDFSLTNDLYLSTRFWMSGQSIHSWESNARMGLVAQGIQIGVVYSAGN